MKYPALALSLMMMSPLVSVAAPGCTIDPMPEALPPSAVNERTLASKESEWKAWVQRWKAYNTCMQGCYWDEHGGGKEGIEWCERYMKEHGPEDKRVREELENDARERTAAFSAQRERFFAKNSPGGSAAGADGFQPADPNQDYTGQPCNYFTKPLERRNAQNDVVGLNVHANGSKVAYGKFAYVCENRLWKRYGFADSFPGIQATNIEN